jgi:hypothetical protein
MKPGNDLGVVGLLLFAGCVSNVCDLPRELFGSEGRGPAG